MYQINAIKNTKYKRSNYGSKANKKGKMCFGLKVYENAWEYVFFKGKKRGFKGFFLNEEIKEWWLKLNGYRKLVKK